MNRWVWAAALLAACGTPAREPSTVAAEAAMPTDDSAVTGTPAEVSNADALPITRSTADDHVVPRRTDADRNPITHPTAANQVVLRWDSHSGYRAAPMPWEPLRDVPAWSLYGDGLAVVNGGRPRNGAWPDLRATRLAEARVQDILRTARGIGLMDRATNFDFPFVSDAGTDVITLNADGTNRDVSAYGLWVDVAEGGQGVDWAARRRLREFHHMLWQLLATGEPGVATYEPQALRVTTQPYEWVRNSPLVGELDRRTPVAWPLVTRLADARGCLVVRGADVAKVRAVAERAEATSPWTSGGAEYLVVLRPMLPDETGC